MTFLKKQGAAFYFNAVAIVLAVAGIVTMVMSSTYSEANALAALTRLVIQGVLAVVLIAGGIWAANKGKDDNGIIGLAQDDVRFHRHPDPQGRVFGQGQAHAAPVGGVGVTFNQPARRQPVDSVGHGAARRQRLVNQLPRRQLVRGALPAQCGQHVELPDLEPVRGEALLAGQIEVPSQPAHPREHRQRLGVEAGRLQLPGRDDAVDLVRHPTYSITGAVSSAATALPLKRS